ncbi:MAG: hypothetical protein ACI4XQ_08035 [Eubacteriales bacterium]|nr:hypothetical protein [Clostridiales bacterium]
MAMSDIERIIAAEAEADRKRTSGAEKAAEIISAAEAEGKAAYEKAIAAAEKKAGEAKAECEELIAGRNEKAYITARVEAERCKSLAAERLDEAAEFICSRIVRG